ncbi:uncharacterized protein LOC126899874 [Daktulosphaira vitifoliae]|uniref:uncharacterized protein LOC126899874 n=1 Tax=Daktulosphaira vitifoliae TaxID=58002 RepID=UPI0021AA25B2|nr:uncharacterized protein LOC126899874 [Daktulosphaira vitifoliae]
MWSKAWLVMCITAVYAVGNLKVGDETRTHQAVIQSSITQDSENQESTKQNVPIPLSTNERNSKVTKSKGTEVDDDLLEFLVRIADNPEEWNRIRRVLSLLGQDESSSMATMTKSSYNSPQITHTILPSLSSSSHSQLPSQSKSPKTSSWPSSTWILEAMKKMKKANEIDVYDYNDDNNDDENDTDEDEGFMTTTIYPTRKRYKTQTGHMSRYQFKRVNGYADNDRINGTYVAVFSMSNDDLNNNHIAKAQNKPLTSKEHQLVRQKKPKPDE